MMCEGGVCCDVGREGCVVMCEGGVCCVCE